MDRTHKIGEIGVWKSFPDDVTMFPEKTEKVLVKNLPIKDERNRQKKSKEIIIFLSSIRWQWYTIQSGWAKTYRKLYQFPSENWTFAKFLLISRQPKSFGIVNCNNGWLIKDGICVLDQWVTSKRASIFTSAVGT